MKPNSRGPKVNGYKHDKADAKRNKRCNEAIHRQVVYESLPLQDKIKRATLRPGHSKRELARLSELAKAS